jgi:transglutaminase-like putative cysteine protease
MRDAETVARAPMRTARETWFDHAVIALALVLLLSGFGTIVEGRDWWVTTILVAAMTGLTCAVLRGLGTRLVAPVAIVVELTAIVWIFVPETLLAIVPTPQTVTALADMVSVAQQTIVEEKAPVAASRPIVLVVAASFGLIVVVADVLLQRRRAAPLVGILLLAVFATPALISGETPPAWLFLSVAALWLVLLRSRTATATRSGTSRLGAAPALALGVAALMGAVAFPAVAPDVTAVAASWGKPPPPVFGRGINPMIELGQNLRRNSTATALTYTTTFDEPQYLKVATLRDFTGRTWKPTETVRADLFEGERLLDSDIEVEPGRTRIDIDQLRSSMLPVPYPSTGTVTGLDGDWTFRRAGQTLTSRDDDSRGQTYTVSSLDVRPTAEQMRGLRTTIGPALESYVELPPTMPSIIARTAREVTADADNDYDRALALQRFFRDGDFRYSETAPVAGDYDGNGVEVIAEFLQKKAGYCVHFSSAMAVMARTLGMPSRIAVGYAPGTSNIRDGEPVYTNTSDDLHAWTEIYFQGAGWVRFDPTKSVGDATSFVEPVVDTPDAEPTPTPEPTQAAPQRGADRLDQPVAAPTEQGSTAPRSAIVTLAALLVVGAVPWAVRSLRRRWRATRGRTDVEPLWRELEDVARDLRIPASAADTPRGFAGRLAGQPGVDHVALQALLQRVERARFSRGQQPAGDGVADLDAVVTSLRAGASRRRRLLATLLPQSLAGRAPVARVAGSGRLAT